jgi:hypothetical protein
MIARATFLIDGTWRCGCAVPFSTSAGSVPRRTLLFALQLLRIHQVAGSPNTRSAMPNPMIIDINDSGAEGTYAESRELSQDLETSTGAQLTYMVASRE